MDQPDERTQRYVDAILGAIVQHPQIREIRAGGYFDPYVLVYDAGLNPDEPEYDEAIAYMLRSRMIEYAEETANVVGNPLYKLTRHAREAMDELDKRDEA
jgi:hypothetical protein